MQFLKSTVGRKLLMAATGLVMIGFTVVHLLGNTSIFIGPDGINAYASNLRKLGPLMWVFRLVMVSAFSLHVFFGIQLTLENAAAKPLAYAVRKNLRTTGAARNMIWTGLIIAAFLLYHLLHFTFQVTNPEISAHANIDSLGRPDVFKMAVLSFGNIFISFVYFVAMAALALHLIHGIQSLFQTFGLNGEASFPVIVNGGTLAAYLLFLGYIAIPMSIIAGILIV